MRGPPDPHSEKGAPARTPQSQISIPRSTAENTDTVRELQAASLRRRFAIGYHFATVIATLAYGVAR